MYAISLERRHLGIFKKRTPSGQLSEGQAFSYQLGKGNVVDLVLDQHHVLTITTNHLEIPVVVKFSAEPLVTRPEVVARLDNNNPEIQTYRRRIAIAQEDDGRQILILEAPKAQTTYATSQEIATSIVAGLYQRRWR